jgi:hypothetical protein
MRAPPRPTLGFLARASSVKIVNGRPTAALRTELATEAEGWQIGKVFSEKISKGCIRLGVVFRASFPAPQTFGCWSWKTFVRKTSHFSLPFTLTQA